MAPTALVVISRFGIRVWEHITILLQSKKTIESDGSFTEGARFRHDLELRIPPVNSAWRRQRDMPIATLALLVTYTKPTWMHP